MDNLPVAMLTVALAGGYLAKVLVDVVTMGWPGRPTWAAPALAILFGILACALVTVANMPSNQAIDRQLIAVIIGAGILSAGAASGATATSNTAEAKRAAEKGPPAEYVARGDAPPKPPAGRGRY